MGLLDFLHGKNPAQAAQPYLNQIGPMAEQRLNPYVQRGNEAGSNVYNQYKGLTENPSDFINQLMSGYTESTGFDMRKRAAEQAMRNSAAAGGYAGTEYDQKRQGELANALSGEDMQNWLQNVLGVYNTGLQGQQGFSNQGYGANQDITSILGNVLGNQGAYAAQGQVQSNTNRNGLLNFLTSILGGAAGGAIGGPAGAMAGANIGSKIW